MIKIIKEHIGRPIFGLQFKHRYQALNILVLF